MTHIVACAMADRVGPGRPGRPGVRDDRGIALVLAMFLSLAASIIAASLMFLSQTESFSTMNYRMMSQARYGAEAGIQRMSNYLMYSYAAPSTGGNDSIASYNATVSPVTYGGNPVILAAPGAAKATNYPSTANLTSFQAAFTAALDTLAAGTTTTINYAPYATLISMEEVSGANSVSGSNFTIQTWQITSDGSISAGSRTATVEVTAVVDTQKYASNDPSLNYAAFATAGTCGALHFTGGTYTASYDSSTAGFTPSSAVSASNGGLTLAGGNVGTNGNLTQAGSATINGTLSTPRVGVGSCSSGNVDADTSGGGTAITGGIVHLPSAVSLTAPNIPTPALGSPPSTNVNVSNSTTCVGLVAAGVPLTNCSGAAGHLTITANGGSLTLGNISITSTGNLTIAPGGTYTMGTVSVAGSGTLVMGGTSGGTPSVINMTSFTTSGGGAATMDAGTYNTNTFSVTGGTTVAVPASNQITLNVIQNITFAGGGKLDLQGTGAAASGVNLNVVNTAGQATPIDFSGGTVANESMNASRFIIEYAGTGNIKLSGGTQQAEAIYAPQASATFTGGAALYGEVISNTVTDTGGATIYYDRHLANTGLFSQLLYQPGNPMMSSFTWKKF